jgi:hypothetical protein
LTLMAVTLQEQALLYLVVNKLGDPDGRVSSHASHNLMRLLHQHPNMKVRWWRAAF